MSFDQFLIIAINVGGKSDTETERLMIEGIIRRTKSFAKASYLQATGKPRAGWQWHLKLIGNCLAPTTTVELS